MQTLRRIYGFYLDGFRGMVLGRTLWKIILIKLFLLFAVIRMFLFPDYLQTNFTTDQERAEHVLDALTNPAAVHNENGRTPW